MVKEELSKTIQNLYNKFVNDSNEPFKHKTFDYKELSLRLMLDMDTLMNEVIKERNAIIDSMGTFYLIKNNGVRATRCYIKIEGCPKVQIEDNTFDLLTPFAYQIIESNYGNEVIKQNKNNPYAYTLIGEEYEKEKI